MTLFDKAMIRVPTLPITWLKQLEEKILNNIPLGAALTERLLESIFISSPEFYDLLNREIGDGSPLQNENLKLSVLKYINRMCQRATPYGTMAYVSVIDIKNHSSPINPDTAILQRVVRLDSEIAVSLLELINSAPEYGNIIQYYPNNSLYQIGSKLRYVETTRDSGVNKYKLSSIAVDAVVKKLLTFAQGGKTKQLLCRFIEGIFPDGEPGEILGYLQDLIDNGILISSLSLNVADTDVVQKIQYFIADYDGPETTFHLRLKENIARLADIMRRTQACLPNQAIENYKEIQEVISSLLSNIDNKKSFVQVDTFRDFRASINKQIPLKLRTVIESLAQINPPYESENFAAFTKAFAERYEGRSVKLMHVLDPDIGLGYPVAKSIQLEGKDRLLSLVNTVSKDPSNTLQYYFNDWHRLLIEKYQESRQLGTNEIRLSLSEMRAFESRKKNALPQTYTVLCKLSATSDVDLDKGKYLLQPFDLHAPSAANVYSRFTHLSESIQSFTEQITRQEQEASTKLNVEVEHIGQVRTANVTLKKVKRAKRINITCSPVPSEKDQYLPLDDILVFYQHNRLVLYSKSLKRQIVPFMTSAYNYNVDDLPIVSFIGDFQQQGNQNSLLWDWGPLKELNDLPRVIIDDNIVAAPAFWTIRKKDLDLTNLSTFIANFQELCMKKAMPRVVLYGIADNLLLVDLENPKYLQMIYKDFSRSASLMFIEDIAKQNGSHVRSLDGAYSSEILFSFFSDSNSSNLEDTVGYLPNIKNSALVPLDNWIYLKLYFTSLSTERQIMSMIRLIIISFKKKKLFDRWFFIRYEDPDPHIRLRIKISHPELLSDVVSIINEVIKPGFQQGKIVKVHYDSYSPELDRYGEENIKSIEKIFEMDSEFIIQYRRLIDQSIAKEELNWLVGLYTIGSYTSICFPESEMDKLTAFCLRIKESFKSEFNFSIDSFKRINKFFHENKEPFKKFMVDKDDSYIKIYNLLQQREDRLRPLFDHLSLSDDIVFSIIHMSFNRLFPVGPRKNEAICYDLFCKHVLPLKR